MKKVAFSDMIKGNRCFVIAEAGINHNGSFDEARRLIDSASKTGVDAIKFQTYITEQRTHTGSPIFDILKKCELPFEDFEKLKKHAEDQNMIFLSTPFDESSAAFLQQIEVLAYKLASFDVVNIPFLKSIAQKGIPTILSTGMASEDEVQNAVNIFKEEQADLALLHCVSSYPLNPRYANLGAISNLKKKFDVPVGYSDHTNGIEVPLYSVAAGSIIVEKHYMIDEHSDCCDAPVSITEAQTKLLVKKIRELKLIVGSGKLGMTEPQKGAEIFRRHGQ